MPRTAKIHFLINPDALQRQRLCGRRSGEWTSDPHKVTCKDCRAHQTWAEAYHATKYDNELDQHTSDLSIERFLVERDAMVEALR